jgi:hypothetical protein
MKKVFSPLLFVLILLGFMAICHIGKAQAPPPPPEEKGTNSNKAPGGGAPIDGGLAITLAMLVGFGAWKWVKAEKLR